jgi:hypothetical protein
MGHYDEMFKKRKKYNEFVKELSEKILLFELNTIL